MLNVASCAMNRKKDWKWSKPGLGLIGLGLISGLHYIRPKLGKARALKLQSMVSLFSRLEAKLYEKKLVKQVLTSLQTGFN